MIFQIRPWLIALKWKSFGRGNFLFKMTIMGNMNATPKKSHFGAPPLSPIRCYVRMINCLKFEFQDLLHWKRRGLNPIFMNFLWCCIIFVHDRSHMWHKWILTWMVSLTYGLFGSPSVATLSDVCSWVLAGITPTLELVPLWSPDVTDRPIWNNKHEIY